MTTVQDLVDPASARDPRWAELGALRGRYAPSPTGRIHLGNASTALLAWLSIRARGGRFLMRIEDLDAPRVRPGATEELLADLGWLGLDWDEGPDVGGPFEPYFQSLRSEDYRRSFDTLREAGRLYPCFCSRKEIAQAASAPQEPGEERRYPGTCADLDAGEAAARIDRGERHAWRFRAGGDPGPPFVDEVRGLGAGPPAADDFVVARSDGAFAYQLAVVVDDDAMGISEVVRGDDLWTSTPRQLHLYRTLGLQAPAFGHVPLLIDADGHRLSKRQQGITLSELRDAGCGAREIVGRLAFLLGLRLRPEPIAARDLVDGFRLGDLPPAPDGIVADPDQWQVC